MADQNALFSLLMTPAPHARLEVVTRLLVSAMEETENAEKAGRLHAASRGALNNPKIQEQESWSQEVITALITAQLARTELTLREAELWIGCYKAHPDNLPEETDKLEARIAAVRAAIKTKAH